MISEGLLFSAFYDTDAASRNDRRCCSSRQYCRENAAGFCSQDDIRTGKYNTSAGVFQKIDGTGFKLNEDMTVDGVKGGDNLAVADQIQFWTFTDAGIGTYEDYYYYDDGSEAGWSKVGDGDPYFEDVHPEGLQAGTGFWYLATKDERIRKITFAGGVNMAAYIDKEIVGGKYSFFGNPYPINLMLNDADQVKWEGVKGGDNLAVADQIQLWTFTDAGIGTYEDYYYYDDGSEAGWSKVGDGDPYFEDVHPEGLAVGTPFWYLAKEGSGKYARFFSPIK